MGGERSNSKIISNISSDKNCDNKSKL